MFNLSPQYETTCMSGGIAPRILAMGSSWKESVWNYAPAACLPGK
jgi:hypothetical protein